MAAHHQEHRAIPIAQKVDVIGISPVAETGWDTVFQEIKDAGIPLLKAHPGKINALYAHNDDMALGAIQAMEEAGLKPGVDIKIVSVDAVRGVIRGDGRWQTECDR